MDVGHLSRTGSLSGGSVAIYVDFNLAEDGHVPTDAPLITRKKAIHAALPHITETDMDAPGNTYENTIGSACKTVPISLDVVETEKTDQCQIDLDDCSLNHDHDHDIELPAAERKHSEGVVSLGGISLKSAGSAKRRHSLSSEISNPYLLDYRSSAASIHTMTDSSPKQEPKKSDILDFNAFIPVSLIASVDGCPVDSTA